MTVREALGVLRAALEYNPSGPEIMLTNEAEAFRVVEAAVAERDEANRVAEMRRVEGKRILDERNALEAERDRYVLQLASLALMWRYHRSRP